MSARYIVGIDLGTTHTVVAYADTHLGVSPAEPSAVPSIHPFAIPQLVGPAQVETRALLPSARYHAANGELAPGALDLPWATGRDFAVGEFASDLGAKSPGRLVRSAKSWLSHDGVDRTAPILPWGAGRDVPQCSPLQASAGYLAHVKEAWNQAFPHEPLHAQDVVLTIPASFDETARSLTVKAAHEAGLPQVRLVEEPQAAFYRWMSVHQDDLDSALDGLRLVLVVDVGGGTTDLTLLRLEARETGPRVTRIAVGDHLMLGGDNMDLALAHLLEPRFGDRGLGSHAFGQLAYQCRLAKERMLHEAAPENVPVSVVGTGSKLIGGARSVSVDRQELQTTLLEGFFPQCEFETAPHKRRAAIVEFGLPYVADPAITHHVAAFLRLHQDLAREALGVAGPAADQGVTSNAIPDAVLFNGGVFRSALLRCRMMSTLGAWRGSVPRELESPSLELAVSAGAVAYGLARRKIGLRIGGGSARTYFLSTTTERPDEGIVLLPRFAEEGEEIVLEKRTFSLRLGKPVRFGVFSSTSQVQHLRPGDLVHVSAETRQDLPPVAAVLEGEGAGEVPVRLAASLSELGALELSCVAEGASERRWKLEFQARSQASADSAVSLARVERLHPRFKEATARIDCVYGKSQAETGPREVKTLRADLEKILGPRAQWNPPILRELFGALWAGRKRRRRSKDHERVWLNLVGYCLRPGYGAPLDDWRCAQLREVHQAGLQFVPEAQNWAEWWTLWRRVAGGLDEPLQAQLLEDVSWYLEPETRTPRKRPKGPRKLGYQDMVRLVGSLERLATAQKMNAGNQLLTRLQSGEDGAQSWWSVGRLGARVPQYGSVHQVVPAEHITPWIERALECDWNQVPEAAFAAALMSRRSGDRERDLAGDQRTRVAARLEVAGLPSTWRQMVLEVTHLDAEAEQRMLGELLPPGLRLLD